MMHSAISQPVTYFDDLCMGLYVRPESFEEQKLTISLEYGRI